MSWLRRVAISAAFFIVIALSLYSAPHAYDCASSVRKLSPRNHEYALWQRFVVIVMSFSCDKRLDFFGCHIVLFLYMKKA